jgi:hypothetical protein
VYKLSKKVSENLPWLLSLLTVAEEDWRSLDRFEILEEAINN